MKHSRKILNEFIKMMKFSSGEDYWENLSREEQEDYLRNHPGSRKKVTAPAHENPDHVSDEKEKKRLVQRIENRKKHPDVNVSGPMNMIGPVERENINKIKDHIIDSLKNDPQFSGVSVTHRGGYTHNDGGPGVQVNFHSKGSDPDLEKYTNDKHSFFVPRRHYQDLSNAPWANAPHPQSIADLAVKHWGERKKIDLSNEKKVEDRRKTNNLKYHDEGDESVPSAYKKKLNKLKDALLNDIDQSGQFDGISFDINNNQQHPDYSTVNVQAHKGDETFDLENVFYTKDIDSMANNTKQIIDQLKPMSKEKRLNQYEDRSIDPHWRGD